MFLSACATISPQETAPVYSDDDDGVPFYLQAGLEDPFDSIDRATRRLGRQPRVISAPDVEDPPEFDLLGRLVDRFSFSECPDGSQALQWASWFGARPDYMERVMDRAHPWLHDIANELEQRDLPGELALLPIVESAYDPFAYSRGRASGTWQFLSGTARDFGVEINDWYDGRRDVYIATRAALDYLSYLNDLFEGDWNLSLAAYNAGQGRVQRAMRANAARNRPTEWDALTLPRETRAYVPKLHGLGCLFREPERFGWERPVWNDEALIAKVELPGPTDVVALSAVADLDITELVALNPGLNRHLTPPSGPHHLIVPIEQAEGVEAALPELNGHVQLVWEEITVRRGDTLSGLAQRHNTSIAALRSANELNGDMLSIGQRLRLPSAKGAAPADSPWADRYQEMARLQQRLLPRQRFQHQVRPGESLWVIARRYSVSVADLQRWNNLGQNSMIRPGQQLAILIDGPEAVVAASPEPVSYTVRNGDSLWLIARRMDVRLADLKRWNNLNDNSILRPGQVLTIRRGDNA